MPYQLIVATSKVRSKLTGIKPVLDALGEGVVEDQITDALKSAQNEFEERSHVWLWQRRVLTYPGGSDVLGTTYDVQADPLDFYTTSYPASSRFELPWRPVAAVSRVAIEYGAANSLLTYPANWLRVNHQLGVLNIVPPFNVGSGDVVGFLPLLTGGFLRGITPLVVSIDYVAGLPDADTNPQWSTLRECITKKAAAIIRENNAGLIANSVGRDGVSVSFDNNTQQIDRLITEFDTYIESFKAKYAPIHIAMV